jgi:tRNA1Val (adenine37-N6)-methyltransferase
MIPSEKGTGIATEAGLFGGALKYEQPESGFRTAVDSLALMQFVDGLCESPPRRVLDIGCGSGFLILTAALLWPNCEGIGVELSEKRYQAAVENLARNVLGHRLSMVQTDARSWARQQAVPFDLVLANPPFFPLGHGTMPPDQDKAMARFELSFRLEDLMEIASRLIGISGILACVYPFERRDEIIEKGQRAKLKLHAEQEVLSRPDLPPRYILTAWNSVEPWQEAAPHEPLKPLLLEVKNGDLGPALRAFEVKLSTSLS